MSLTKAILTGMLLSLLASISIADEKQEETKADEQAKSPTKPLFPDKNLEAVVRRNVFEKRDNDEPLTEKDVENISTIEGKGKGIRDLRGLEKCLSLALLDLEDNDIADIDPIMDLKNLQSLNLAKNRIGDLTAIEKLERLQYLHLANNRVSDLEPIAGLKNLRSLYLSNNRIKDLSPLAELSKLWSLYVDGNRLKSLAAISKLKWLTSLDLRRNELEHLTWLEELPELNYLAIENNKITDLGPLVRMAEKDAAGRQQFAPFWRIYLANNPLSDDAKQQIEKLKELGGRVFAEAIPE